MPRVCTICNEACLTFIYGIRQKGGDVFYIGSTAKTILRRFQQHLRDVRRGSHCNRGFANQCQLVGIESLEVVELQQACLAHREHVEYQLIQQYLADGKELTNKLRSLRDRDRAMLFPRPPKQLVVARQIYKLAWQMFALTKFAWERNRPLCPVHLRGIALLKSRAEDYKPLKDDIDAVFEMTLPLYAYNPNGLARLPLYG